MQPPFSFAVGGIGVRLLFLLLVVMLPAAAHAQVSKGMKSVLQAAATVCVELASGRADFKDAPPPGFRAASPLERFGFNIGAGADGHIFESVWVDRTNGPAERWIVKFDKGCMVYSVRDLIPAETHDIADEFNAMMRAINPDVAAMTYYSSEIDRGEKSTYYELRAFPDLMVSISQAVKKGTPIKGQLTVVVQQWDW